MMSVKSRESSINFPMAHVVMSRESSVELSESVAFTERRGPTNKTFPQLNTIYLVFVLFFKQTGAELFTNLSVVLGNNFNYFLFILKYLSRGAELTGRSHSLKFV